jgi:transposase
MTRTYARCREGARIQEGAPGGRWKMPAILGALSTRGVIAAMTIEEAAGADIFLAYLDRCLCPQLHAGDVTAMDNLSSHKVQGVQQKIEKCGAELLYLPPCSPDLNLIEKAWPKLKQLLRSDKARSKESLEEAIAEAIKLITPENAKTWLRLCINSL